MKADYVIQQGEELSLSLIAIEGDISDVVEASAVLKHAGPNGSAPGVSAPIVATFNVSDAEAPDLGWQFNLAEADTEVLKPGFYVTNAKLELVSGGPLKTDHLLIEVKASVT